MLQQAAFSSRASLHLMRHLALAPAPATLHSSSNSSRSRHRQLWSCSATNIPTARAAANSAAPAASPKRAG